MLKPEMSTKLELDPRHTQRIAKLKYIYFPENIEYTYSHFLCQLAQFITQLYVAYIIKPPTDTKLDVQRNDFQ